MSPTLSLAHLSVTARLTEVSLTLSPGDCIVVIGANGAGKSTLLRAMVGLERPSAGAVLLDGRPLAEFSPRERARRVAWLPQRPRLGEAVRIEELVATGRYRFGESHGEALAHARRALTELGAEHLAPRFTDRVSGGELQRALLATLLAQEAPLLLVDEPANHLDPAQQLAAYGTLGQLWRRGHGLIVVTHDLNLAAQLGSPERVRVLGLDGGHVAFDSTLSAPSLTGDLTRLYGVDLCEVELRGERHWLAAAPRGASETPRATSATSTELPNRGDLSGTRPRP
jgi:iron complex transport system ATP-binding protein